jgi:sulfur carrier protein ThiS
LPQSTQKTHVSLTSVANFFMNVKIEFVGFPVIYDIFPEGPHPFVFSGETLPELIQSLAERKGVRVRESLLDPRTQSLDPAIQIMINRKFLPKEEIPSRRIEAGDHVTFLKLLAGG